MPANRFEEAILSLNSSVRKTHRWLSIIFTLTMVANFATMLFQQPPLWVTYSPLPPLFLMLFTGLYMFFLPYAARRPGSHARLDAR